MRSREDGQESELARENMRGFGSEKIHHHEPAIDDDQELSR